MNDKEKQEISLLGRIFSMEVLLFLMGCVSLVSGFYTGELTQYFWGVLIIGGSIALHFVRKRDWKKHWADLELQQQAYNELERRRKEEEKNGR